MSPPAVFSLREPLSAYLERNDYVSSSALRRFSRFGSAAAALPSQPVPKEATIGDALHALLLEPERFDDDYFGIDHPARPPADVEALMGRTWLSTTHLRTLQRMRDAVLAHRMLPLREWFASGERELSIYWRDDDGGCWKGRPDCFGPEVVLELKTTVDVRPRGFQKSRRRFGYDLQAAHYLEGVERLTGKAPRFLYVAVETGEPHTVWVHEPSRDELRHAREQLDSLKTRFREQRALEPQSP